MKYGADATRWYLLAVSPPWMPTRFDEDGVKEVYAKFFGTLQNVYSFFTLYANIDEADPATYDIPVTRRGGDRPVGVVPVEFFNPASAHGYGEL